ncbi:hypothetical protein QA612_14100 [Evansella sp. AB-P1]|uniref:radical SAM protein n=1 Tax=Evansella sp. AB-P1 TaxID=3037653 RepID=UPI00241C8C10|nr:radical SAM protein [Evansella sp. AB-P1]MDG5788613.1 hypothetical protein [Evansella sp. AB-P1]
MSQSKNFEVPVNLINEIVSNSQIPAISDVEQIINEAKTRELNLSEINSLINAIGSSEFNKIKSKVLKVSQKLREEVFGKKVHTMAPVEVSNFCMSDCVFCGWRASNKSMNRLRMPKELILEQIKYLINKGIYTIELVGGDDIEFVRDKLPILIKEVRKMFPPGIKGRIIICTMALTDKQYQHLKKIGADGVITWQETYSKELYNKSIVAGPKAFGITDSFKIVKQGDGFTFRLQSQDRAYKAGLQVALGTMIGFNENLAFEILATICHAKHFINNYSIDESNPVIIGMPTWNTITTKDTDNRPIDHESIEPYFSYISALYFLACPKSKVWVFPNCRVSLPTQIEAVATSGYFTSTEVKVGPGGYLKSAIENMEEEKKERIISFIKENMDKLSARDEDIFGLLDRMEQFNHTYHLHEKYIESFKEYGIELD